VPEGWIRIYAGQAVNNETVSIRSMQRYGTWINYPREWSLPHPIRFAVGPTGIGLIGFGSDSDDEGTDLQVLALPAHQKGERDPHRDRFNASSAIWLTVSNTIKSFRDLGSKGWIIGGLVAAITWLLGGFDFSLISAICLAVMNSVVQVFVDIKQGDFTATKMFSRIGQFPAFMGFIALGRIADYGTQEHIIIFRSLMVLLVIVACFWSSFRGLAQLAGWKLLRSWSKISSMLVPNS
jgi:hypothetical protein